MDGHFNVVFYLKGFCSFSCSRQNVWHGRINSKKTLCVRIASTDQKFLVVFCLFHFEIQMDSIYSSVKVISFGLSFLFQKKILFLAIPQEHRCLTLSSRALLSQLPRDLKPLQGPGKVPGGLCLSLACEAGELREAECCHGAPCSLCLLGTREPLYTGVRPRSPPSRRTHPVSIMAFSEVTEDQGAPWDWAVSILWMCLPSCLSRFVFLMV